MDIFPASDVSDSDEGEGSSLDLCVVGYACRVFSDDEAAARVDNNEHLHCWNNELGKRLLIDRYDVRCLLDDEAAFAKAAPTADEWDYGLRNSQRRMLDHERYRELMQQEDLSRRSTSSGRDTAGTDDVGASTSQRNVAICACLLSNACVRSHVCIIFDH